MPFHPQPPGTQALAEWKTFLAHYDVDGAIVHEISNDPVEGIQEDWSLYNIYTKEMGKSWMKLWGAMG